MRVLLFGTYDASAHPRIAILGEGLRDSGMAVSECNGPLGLAPAARVAMLAHPWRTPALLGRLARRWLTLSRQARRLPAPDVVVVGYLGHFDVHLARLLFRRVPVVLDHLVGASDTGRDRRLDGGPRQGVLRLIDAAALRAADVVLVDTEEHRLALPARYQPRAVVVPVGASEAWYAAAPAAGEVPGGPPPASEAVPGPLRVVFYGLYTPLQGAPVIGAALSLLAGTPVEVTMIGDGQDAAAAKAAAAANGAVRWVDWVPAADLPALVASHHVCLGIFGTGDKARRVVPNKVFQGAAAGCAIVTSDTPPQRRVLADAAVLVPPGDPEALAGALRRLGGARAPAPRPGGRPPPARSWPRSCGGCARPRARSRPPPACDPHAKEPEHARTQRPPPHPPGPPRPSGCRGAAGAQLVDALRPRAAHAAGRRHRRAGGGLRPGGVRRPAGPALPLPRRRAGPDVLRRGAAAGPGGGGPGRGPQRPGRRPRRRPVRPGLRVRGPRAHRGRPGGADRVGGPAAARRLADDLGPGPSAPVRPVGRASRPLPPLRPPGPGRAPGQLRFRRHPGPPVRVPARLRPGGGPQPHRRPPADDRGGGLVGGGAHRRLRPPAPAR